MHRCEFCNKLYSPRPQVKNPRACKECQKKRQRANEKEWQMRHKGLYDSKYHRAQKEKRISFLTSVISDLLDCLKTGMKFLNHKFNIENIEKELTQLLLVLGIRRVNKFWIAKKAC